MLKEMFFLFQNDMLDGNPTGEAGPKSSSARVVFWVRVGYRRQATLSSLPPPPTAPADRGSHRLSAVGNTERWAQCSLGSEVTH